MLLDQLTRMGTNTHQLYKVVQYLELWSLIQKPNMSWLNLCSLMNQTRMKTDMIIVDKSRQERPTMTVLNRPHQTSAKNPLTG